MVGDGAGFTAKSDDGDDAGYLQHLEASFEVEAAKNIAREEWEIDDLDAVGPAAAGTIEGQIAFQGFGSELVSHGLFVLRPDGQSIPMHGLDRAGFRHCDSH
jgi:hypothetical protein